MQTHNINKLKIKTQNESIKLFDLQYDNCIRNRIAFVGRNYPDSFRPNMACNQSEICLPEYRQKDVGNILENQSGNQPIFRVGLSTKITLRFFGEFGSTINKRIGGQYGYEKH